MTRSKPFEVGDLICSDTTKILSDGQCSLALVLKVTYAEYRYNKYQSGLDHSEFSWDYDVYSFDDGRVYVQGWREDADNLKQHFKLVARCEE